MDLSVVVPAHAAAADLPHCIAALEASDLPREKWELIVIDDSLGKGPAFARNRGIEKARAEIVAFVDSDVMVHRDALGLMLDHFQSDDVHAVFGSYDSKPTDKGIVSQYRNLLHAYVHQHADGDVESFWAGCGAARKASLTEVGMFDEERFVRPEMEDVELGYRLSDKGCRIILDPAIQCTHRKRWTLGEMIRSDFSRRGVPWTRLLIDRRELSKPRGLSVGSGERIAAVAAPVSVLSLAAALLTRQFVLFAIALIAWISFIYASSGFFNWLERIKGHLFLLVAIPLHLIYNSVAFSALVWGIATSRFNRSWRERYTPLQ